MKKPLVSVLLPVYNGSRYLRKAIDSILGQTFRDYEFVIIDDGSADNTMEIIKSYRDERIRAIHQNNKGLAATLNIGIVLCNGTYIARMDSDDISMPTRLEKQVTYMENHPRCALLGTRAEIWIGDKRTDRFHDHPTDNLSLKFELMFDNYFVHASVMLRKSALEDLGGYTTDPVRQPPEDYELWSRFARKYEVANLPERLTIYREFPNSLSRVTTENPFVDKLIFLSSENIAYELGLDEPSANILDLAALIHNAPHRLSKHPNIKGICVLIDDLCQKINFLGTSSDVLNRARFRRNMVKVKYLCTRYKHLGPVIQLAYEIRRLIKS